MEATQATDNTLHKIGYVHNWDWTNNGATDGEIITIDKPAPAPAGWTEPTNYVVVWANSSNSPPNAYNEYYPINYDGPGSVMQNTYLCRVGATSGTYCGRVQNDRATVTYNGVTIKDTLLLNGGLACMGDSGGPTLISQTAYGTFVAYGGTPSTMLGPNGGVQNCGNVWWAVYTGNIEAELNVTLVT
jgi:hypothetical protein